MEAFARLVDDVDVKAAIKERASGSSSADPSDAYNAFIDAYCAAADVALVGTLDLGNESNADASMRESVTEQEREANKTRRGCICAHT